MEKIKTKLKEKMNAAGLKKIVKKVDLGKVLRKIDFDKILKRGPKKVLSIDFGCGFIKIVCLQSLGQSSKLLAYNIKKIASFAEERDEILEFINNFIKVHAIEAKEIYVTVSDPESIITKRLTLSGISKEETLKVAKWQLQEGLSFSMEEAVIESRNLGEFTDEEGVKKSEIMFVVAYARALRQYLLLINECKLIPIIASIGPLNYSYLLKRIDSTQEKTQALLDIGQHSSTLCIFKGSELTLARTLSFSSDKLTKSLTSPLTSERGKIALSLEEAEKIKGDFGIPEDLTQQLKEGIHAADVMSLLQPVLDELVRDFRFTFYYYTSNYKEEAPANLYLTGGGAKLKNLVNYLKRELSIEVARLPVPECILTEGIDKNDLEKDKNQLMNALGAAFAPSFGAVNLLPPEFRSLKREFIEKSALRVFTFVIWAIFLASSLVVYGRLSSYKNELKYSQFHLQTIQQFQDLKRQCDLREDFINKIQSSRVPVEGILKALSALITPDLILNRLSLDQGKDTLTFKGEVSTTGEVAAARLTNFMKRIETSSYFKETQLVSSEKVGEAQKFEIKCILIQ